MHEVSVNMAFKRKYTSQTSRNFSTMLRNMRSVQRNVGTTRSSYNRKQIASAKNSGNRRTLSNPRSTVGFSAKRILHDSRGMRSINGAYAVFPSQIVQGTLLNQRERQAIYATSLDLNFHFRSNKAWTPAPSPPDAFPADVMHLRLFVVRVRNSEGGLSASTMYQSLFRGSQTSRYVDYLDTANGHHALTYPLNTQKFEILYDNVFVLKPRSQDETNNELNISKRIPINRRLVYETDNPDTCRNGIYIGYFARNPFSLSTTVGSDDYWVTHTNILNFRDVN